MSGSENPTEKDVAKEASVSPTASDLEATSGLRPIDDKPFMEAIWPVLACGAGLFSDGYINNVRPLSRPPCASLFDPALSS